jgi:hypothetical protein
MEFKGKKSSNMKQMRRIGTTALDSLPVIVRHSIYLKTRAKIAST